MLRYTYIGCLVIYYCFTHLYYSKGLAVLAPLPSVRWYLFTDVSGQPVFPISLTLEDGPEILSRKVGKQISV